LGIDACCDDYVEIELEIGIPIDEDFKAKRNPEHLKRKEDILAKINSLENILDTKLKNGVELKEEELDRITLQVESLKLRFEKIK
jgi:transcription initiation factor IIF auxiliary subunit